MHRRLGVILYYVQRHDKSGSGRQYVSLPTRVLRRHCRRVQPVQRHVLQLQRDRRELHKLRRQPRPERQSVPMSLDELRGHGGGQLRALLGADCGLRDVLFQHGLHTVQCDGVQDPERDCLWVCEWVLRRRRGDVCWLWDGAPWMSGLCIRDSVHYVRCCTQQNFGWGSVCVQLGLYGEWRCVRVLRCRLPDLLLAHGLYSVRLRTPSDFKWGQLPVPARILSLGRHVRSLPVGLRDVLERLVPFVCRGLYAGGGSVRGDLRRRDSVRACL